MTGRRSFPFWELAYFLTALAVCFKEGTVLIFFPEKQRSNAATQHIAGIFHMSQHIPFWEVTCTFESMIFLLPKWNMLVFLMVQILHHPSGNFWILSLMQSGETADVPAI